ncbi:MAG: ribonuclease III [Chloroflexi bacterium]|nr:MAG: ribonuclease III [Chloroflexota bacterium]
MDINALEKALKIKFEDKSLLHRSMIHRSYLNEHPDFPLEDNERLEFLGDAVLDFIIGEYLYHRFPELQEGPLTSLRSALVRRDTLARFASQLSLGRYLLMGHGEAESGGRERPATLCATFEALVGALYLDQGLSSLVQLLEPLIIPEIGRILEEELHKDAKSRLQELAQGLMRHTPRYATVSQTGPDHAKEFTVQVTIGGRVYGQGKGLSKQQAAQEAAQDALERIAADRDSAEYEAEEDEVE